MDQFNQHHFRNETFTIPLIRLRGRHAKQNILLNPGGPGGSGIWFIHRLGEQLSTIIGEDLHLVAFDPRGVNGSRPFADCYPDDETRHSLGSVRDQRVLEDSAEVYAWTKNYVRACAETMGEHGKHLNTPQTAADMNSIIDALGQDDMIYWGFSYGTILGQTYAGLFPERSRRIIIDGVNNVFDWYGGLLDTEDLVDSETVFDGFLDECIKAREDCPLARFGPSKEALRERILSLASALRQDPLNVYVDNRRYGLLDDRTLLYDAHNAIPAALKKPVTWPTLAENLAKWLDGNATDAFLAYGLGKPWPSAGDAERFVMLNDGASGARYWPQDRQTMLDWLVPFINRSIFAPTEHGVYYAKQQWLVPKTHSYVPSHTVQTAHPLLILTMTYDPVCPLISARSAQRAFQGSQIVEVEGYGHCSTAMPSVCLARHVRAYLQNGTVPALHTKCKVDGTYFPPIQERVNIEEIAIELFEEVEDRRIFTAQVELARNW
ncbi:Alpha/Beta hydrolase protein [Xylaria bambusicola]|uniref:Alpha/Beta hydrolase protein n=1 Tax=Xylaria bambusicola TaxID=326684 RepID=UPI00200800B6|nr:Alpha/Beta hydrolase protein [Xylaria bambusicola]KAI0526726.1 Alpha/Beta hydrolase protein [Xylaria bambusicola]